jgi:hypothetical protein
MGRQAVGTDKITPEQGQGKQPDQHCICAMIFFEFHLGEPLPPESSYPKRCRGQIYRFEKWGFALWGYKAGNARRSLPDLEKEPGQERPAGLQIGCQVDADVPVVPGLIKQPGPDPGLRRIG